jgi:hypothetical protein
MVVWGRAVAWSKESVNDLLLVVLLETAEERKRYSSVIREDAVLASACRVATGTSVSRNIQKVCCFC